MKLYWYFSLTVEYWASPGVCREVVLQHLMYKMVQERAARAHTYTHTVNLLHTHLTLFQTYTHIGTRLEKKVHPFTHVYWSLRLTTGGGKQCHRWLSHQPDVHLLSCLFYSFSSCSVSSSAPSKVMAKAAYTLNGETRMLSWLPNTGYMNSEVPQDDVARESGVVWCGCHRLLRTSITQHRLRMPG